MQTFAHLYGALKQKRDKMVIFFRAIVDD